MHFQCVCMSCVPSVSLAIAVRPSQCAPLLSPDLTSAEWTERAQSPGVLD